MSATEEYWIRKKNMLGFKSNWVLGTGKYWLSVRFRRRSLKERGEGCYKNDLLIFLALYSSILNYYEQESMSEILTQINFLKYQNIAWLEFYQG